MSDYTLEWNGDAITQEIEKAARLGLLESAADLTQESSDEAPVLNGDLKGNAHPDKRDLNKLIVYVAYDLDYALRQHEELSYNHPMGGKAKFLEDPFRRNAQKYVNHIGKRIAQAIK